MICSVAAIIVLICVEELVRGPVARFMRVADLPPRAQTFSSEWLFLLEDKAALMQVAYGAHLSWHSEF